MRPDVICVGAAKHDSLVRIDHQLAEDERVVTDQIVNAAGGNANTAAAAVARMGVSVALCTTVGRDIAGDYLLSRMAAFGVATGFVSRRAEFATPQSINIVNSSSDTRSIITVQALAFEMDEALRSAPKWFHFDAEGFRAAREAIRSGKLKGKVSVDAGIGIGTDDLKGIDLYAPTESAILETFGGPLDVAMARAAAAGAGDVVVTLGSAGAAVLVDGRVRYVPGYKVDVVSTLGAGDVFHGAVVAGLARGQGVTEAVGAACVCAALSCRALDGQSGIPHLRELAEHLDRFNLPGHAAAEDNLVSHV